MKSKEPQNQQLPKYFVYVKSLGKWCPQLWYDDLTDGTGKFKHGEVNPDGPLVFFHRLTDEEKQLSFEQLIEKFKGKINEENSSSSGTVAS